MKNIKLTLLGTAALLIAVGLNIRHALNDYGVRDNKLHVEVLAQSNGSGGGGSNSGGSGGGSTDGNGGGSTDGSGGGSTDGNSGGGSNNSGTGNMYYYEHLLGGPQDCTLVYYVDASGKVYYQSDGAGAGIKLEKRTTTGTKETCPYTGNGCTVYSCHVTNNTGSGT